MNKVAKGWHEFIEVESKEPYFKHLQTFLENEYHNKQIFPPREQIFRALELTDFNDVKVVILGQDPYHHPGQAHGLAFSVTKGTDIPPSLTNIYKEISNDIGVSIANHGDLTSWATQGVLLLNAILTVEAFHALSHQHQGWELFTDHLIRYINEDSRPKVFLFWGNFAKSKIGLITNSIHLVLTAPHPSPLSAYHGFFGCKHFSKVNQFLSENGRSQIRWEIK